MSQCIYISLTVQLISETLPGSSISGGCPFQREETCYPATHRQFVYKEDGTCASSGSHTWVQECIKLINALPVLCVQVYNEDGTCASSNSLLEMYMKQIDALPICIYMQHICTWQVTTTYELSNSQNTQIILEPRLLIVSCKNIVQKYSTPKSYPCWTPVPTEVQGSQVGQFAMRNKFWVGGKIGLLKFYNMTDQARLGCPNHCIHHWSSGSLESRTPRKMLAMGHSMPCRVNLALLCQSHNLHIGKLSDTNVLHKLRCCKKNC